jgi:hypothetical protein
VLALAIVPEYGSTILTSKKPTENIKPQADLVAWRFNFGIEGLVNGVLAKA